MGRTIQSRGSVVKPHYTMNDKKQDITAMLAGVTQSYASWMVPLPRLPPRNFAVSGYRRVFGAVCLVCLPPF